MENEFSTQRDLLDAYVFLACARREALDNPSINVEGYTYLLHASDYIREQITDHCKFLTTWEVDNALRIYVGMMGLTSMDRMKHV